MRVQKKFSKNILMYVVNTSVDGGKQYFAARAL